MTYELASGSALVTGFTPGFVLTEKDPFWVLDMDDVIKDGVWLPEAWEILTMLHGCGVEISSSGNGAHVIGVGEPSVQWRNNSHFQFFTNKRGIAITDKSTTGSAMCDVCPNEVLLKYLPDTSSGATSTHGWTAGPCEGWCGPDDDEELLKMAVESTSSLSVSFRDLWEANADALSVKYPADGRPFDASCADAALCSHLAFWTGKDCGRMDRMFRKSGLYREKWERESYREQTITCACANTRNVLKQSPKDVAPGSFYLTITDQKEYFDGCVYVQSKHRVWTPQGALLKPDQFRAMYGGYQFAKSVDNQKSTDNAFDAFIQAQGLGSKKVNKTCFRPDLPRDHIFTVGHTSYVNTFRIIDTPCKAGDPSPFLDLMSKLFPNPRDHKIIMTYMASLIQNQGTKFQWWPLIQGVEGNGKTAMVRVIAESVGWEHTHLPNPELMVKSDFNAWIEGNVFLGVEEIKMDGKWYMFERMKTIITNDRIEVQQKGIDQVTGENRCNGLMCSNHKDAIMKSKNDRRVAPFFCPQQEKSDLIQWGMSGTYFPNLYKWLKSGGYAICTHYMKHYHIDTEFDPAGGCQIAPETTGTGALIEMSLSPAEQEILNAIEEDRPGFRGGYVNSWHLDELLRVTGYKVPRNKRRELMRGLGYDYHPSLSDGKSSVIIGSTRPKLYVRTDGELFTKGAPPGDVVDHYIKCNGLG